MKLHLPQAWRLSILAAFAAIPCTLSPAQALTALSTPGSYSDTQFYLDQDIQIQVSQYFELRGIDRWPNHGLPLSVDGRGHTLTGQIDLTFLDEDHSDYDGFSSNIMISNPDQDAETVIKNITFKDINVYAYGRLENVTMKGLCFLTTSDTSLEGVTVLDGSFLSIDYRGTLPHSYVINSNIEFNILGSSWPTPISYPLVTIDGDLVMNGGCITLAYLPTNSSIGSLGSYTDADLKQAKLVVTGTLTLQTPSNICFTANDSPSSPVPNQAVIKCADFSGDIRNLRPCSTYFYYGFDYEPIGNGGYYFTNTENLTMHAELIAGMSFEAVAEEDGYTIYLRQGGEINVDVDPSNPYDPPLPGPFPGGSGSSDEPGSSTPSEPIVILEGSVPDGILGKDYTIEVSGGKTVDASGSAETMLDGSAISGTGTLVTNSDQTILITSNQDIAYSISGTDGSTPGASLVFGSQGGSINSQMSVIEGPSAQSMNLNSMKIMSGIVTNRSTVSSTSVIEVGTGTGSAALNNYGSINAQQGIVISNGGSLDNRGSLQSGGDITVRNGAIFANNSTVDGTITVEKGGLLKGTGTATAATVSGTLNVGNSPGFQRYESLTLNNGSQLIFTVDGSTPATLTRYGEGTYSQINVTTPGGLTVNGTATAQVVFTSNAVLGTLQSGSMTLPLTLITVNDAEGNPADATTTAGITYSVGGELANFITLDASSGALVADLNSAAVIVGMGGSARDLANTLWSSTMVVNSFARQASAQISPARRLSTGEQKDGMAVWGAGLGDFTNVCGADGFTYSGGGYAVGVDGTLNGNLRGGIAFGQQWGTFKSDARGTKVDQDSTMVGLYGGYSGSSDKLDYQITGYAAYGTTDNDSRTSLGGIATGRGDWDSDTATWGLRGEMAYRYSDRASIGAFIGLDYLYGSMGSFTELYDAGLYRNVSDGAMQVWRMPIGITWKGEYSLGGSQYLLPAISLAYVGDISRTNPHVSTETLGMQGRAKGSNIGRNAFLLNAGATWLISDQWSASAAYNLEVRSGQTAQSINAGVRYAF